MSAANRWTMSDESALAYFESEHPACEQCHQRCCIRPDMCSSCRDEDIGVAVGPDKLHVHVGCRSAYENAVAVMVAEDALKVLNGPLYGLGIPEEAIKERARNLVQHFISIGWGPL